MAIDLPNFLLSLAAAMTTTAQPQTPALAVGVDIVALEAVEGVVASSYAVLRNYGGPPPEELWRIDKISIQLAAYSKSSAAATRLCWRFYESLRFVDASGESKPRYSWNIPGKKIGDDGTVVDDPDTAWQVCLVIFAAPPGYISVDDRDMHQVSFNFDCRFAPVPVS